MFAYVGQTADDFVRTGSGPGRLLHRGFHHAIVDGLSLGLRFVQSVPGDIGIGKKHRTDQAAARGRIVVVMPFRVLKELLPGEIKRLALRFFVNEGNGQDGELSYPGRKNQ